MKKFVFKILFLFCLSFIVTFPLNFDFLIEPNQYTNFLSEMIVSYLINYKTQSISISTKLLSDSTALYIHTFFLSILCFLISLFLEIYEHFFYTQKINYSKLSYWFFVILRYYLALVLFQYGFAKIFKTQFYLPEPNILFTPLGFLDKDILYWSAIGSSKVYNFFGGFVEIMAASLLLYRRTYLLGSSISCLLMSHIMAINFGFNISVKVFSSFLFLISCVLVSPNLKNLLLFFTAKKEVTQNLISITYPNKKTKTVYIITKIIIIFWIGVISLFPYFEKNNFDENRAIRPKLHGAYDVIVDSLTSKKLDSITSFFPFQNTKRVFIHKKFYIITQSYQDDFVDYKVKFDKEKIKLISAEKQFLIDYKILNDSTLELYSENYKITLKKINWQELPLLKDDFEWSID